MDKKRIDRIIEIKEKIKQDKEREIEEAVSKMSSICDEIRSVEGDIEKNYAKISANPLSGNDFAVIKDYLEYLDISRISLICEKESAQEQIDFLKEEFYELAREMKMLCTLKQKILKVIKKTQNRREQKMLDELALRLEDKRL